MAYDATVVPTLLGMTEDQAVDAMAQWFSNNFEDPSSGPFGTREEGVRWVEGGPYYAREELTVFADELAEAFGNASVDQLIARAATEFEGDVRLESPERRGREPYEDEAWLATEDGRGLVTENGEKIVVAGVSPRRDIAGSIRSLQGQSSTETVNDLVRWFHREYTPAPKDELGAAYRGWTFYDGGIPTMQALSSISDYLTAEFDQVRTLTIIGDAAAVIENESEGVNRWVPLTPQARGFNAYSAHLQVSEKDAREKAARAVNSLAETMSRVQPPAPTIGHNNPPEPMETGPWDWNDWDEIEAAVAETRRQISSPVTDPGAVHKAARVLSEKAQKFSDWIKLGMGLAGSAVIIGFFNEFGASLYRHTAAAAQALQAWLSVL